MDDLNDELVPSRIRAGTEQGRAYTDKTGPTDGYITTSYYRDGAGQAVD